MYSVGRAVLPKRVELQRLLQNQQMYQKQVQFVVIVALICVQNALINSITI